MESDPPFVKDIDTKAANGDEGCKAASRCLQAMRSVICASGCPVSSTGYFAATVAALQAQGDQMGKPDDKARTSALLLVLRRAILATPAATVQSRFSDVVTALSGVLKKEDVEGVAKQAVGCLGAAADAAYNAGARPNRKVLKPIFSRLGDTRKPVRQQAELTATLILKRAAATSDQQTIDFMCEHLAQLIAQAKHDKKAPDDIPARHAVALLKECAPSLPAENLQTVCMAVLKLPTLLGQHPCAIEGFECLASLLGGGSDALAGAKQLAAGLLQGLLEVPLPLLNVAYVVAHAKALSAAAATLVGTPEGAACRAQVTAAFRKVLALFSERDPGVLRGAREACLGILATAGERSDMQLLQELPDMCRPLLAYECKGSWTQSLPVVAGVFLALDGVRQKVALTEVAAWTGHQFGVARTLLEELFAIRDKSRGAELNVYGEELDECLCSAVTTFGPQNILSIAPLQLLDHALEVKGYEQQARSWMLLVLRESCRRTSLTFFASNFLPLATALKARSEAAGATSPVHAKKYAILLEHVWAVLPAFFDEPLDLSEALLAGGGQLAKQLVAVLLGESQLRDYLWMSFKRVCDATKEPPSPLTQAAKEANIACLRTLSSRVLPEMFNAYLRVHAECEGQDLSISSHSRHLALSTVQTYASIAEPGLVGGLFKNLVAKLLKATTGQADPASPAEQQAAGLSDLANALLPHLSAEFLELALKVFTPMLSSAAGDSENDKSSALALQKGGYKAIRSILEHPATGKIGNAEKILGLWATLRDARQTCVPAALKVRLTAIEALLSLMQANLAPSFQNPAVRKEFLQCLTTVLPEILFHLRDQGQAVRDAARACLHVAATTAVHQELQAEIIALLSAGLAGLTRHSKASAVDALSRLLYEHSHNMSEELLKRLVQVVLLLLGDSDAQVWRAAMKFTKVVVFVLPQEYQKAFLPQILVLFQSRHLGSAKMMVRRIVERLVKTLPQEQLAAAFPKAHLPLLQYVQRQTQRRQRPKGARAAGGDGDADAQAEEADADMGEGQPQPKQSWDDFDKGDEEFRGPESFGTDKQARRRRRAEGADAEMAAPGSAVASQREPPTSSVAAHEAVQALLDAWEAESDSDGEGGRKRRGQKSKRKRDGGEASTWIHEDADVPLDFMSADAAHSVLTTRPAEKKRQRGAEIGKLEALRRSGLTFSKDGRLVVAEVLDNPQEDDAEGKFTHGADTKKVKPLSQLAAKRKARALAKMKSKYEHRGTHSVRGMEGFKPGTKKAQGDATRKSKLNPYAFVRLNPKVTKEKFKDRAARSFSKVVQGAKKGVVKGLKAKARDMKVKKAAEVRKQKQKRSRQARKPTHAR